MSHINTNQIDSYTIYLNFYVKDKNTTLLYSF